MSRPTPAPTADQVAALQRAKRGFANTWRQHAERPDTQKNKDKIIPLHSRMGVRA